MKSKILDNIRNIRRQLGRTQAEMAEEMGLSLTAYGNFERGITKLTEERIETFAKVSGKAPSYIVNGFESVEGEATTLEEYHAREDRLKDLLREANTRIEELEKDLKSARDKIASQEHTISLLEDIRGMLERQLSGR